MHQERQAKVKGQREPISGGDGRGRGHPVTGPTAGMCATNSTPLVPGSMASFTLT